MTLNRKDIETYRGYVILRYVDEDGYRVDFGTLRSKLVDTIQDARDIVCHLISGCGTSRADKYFRSFFFPK